MAANKKPATLEESLKELMQLIRRIDRLEKEIDKEYGVRMVVGYVPSNIDDAAEQVVVRRGIEAIEQALGEQAKDKQYFNTIKELRHHGIVFVQYPDDKTKTFVKAFKEPPKVQIVEE